LKIQFLKANNGDSILISLEDENKIQRHIVIDSGMPQTYFFATENKYGDFKEKIVKPITDAGQKIDLLILTHIDEDHIGGIWKWFAKEKDTAYQIISSIWFNSGKAIAEKFKISENPLLQNYLEIFTTSQTSVEQAVTFEEYINEHDLWDKKLIGQTQVYEKFGLKFQILSPGIQQLKDLVEHYRGEVKDDYFTSGTVDYDRNIKSFIEEEADEKWKFEEDDTVTNGSAIAFIMEHGGEKFLFLADAHPNVIITELKRLKYSPEEPLSVKFVKLSHHGSSFNTNLELLKLIKTDHYIISTSGQRHSHPHKRTISRIVASNPNANIYFNYELIRQAVWNKQDTIDYPNVSLKLISVYPDDI